MKYAAKAFGKMSQEERQISSFQLLLKIHTITGWTVPVSELMDVLVEQLEQKLNESYANVNEKEVEYAFRNRGIDTKDWGKALNLTMIDEVMIPYLEMRFDLSRTEESLKNKPVMIEQKVEMTDADWEEWIVDIRNYSLELIPVSCYDYLLRVGKIKPTTAEKKEYMQKASPIYSTSIQEDIKLWNEYLKQKQDNQITGKHFDSLVTISKRLIVKNYFDNNK